MHFACRDTALSGPHVNWNLQERFCMLGCYQPDLVAYVRYVRLAA